MFLCGGGIRMLQLASLADRRRAGRSLLLSIVFAGLLALPRVGSLAGDSKQPAKTAPNSGEASGAPVAVLSGRVTDETGNPLPDARVIVAIPATNMRPVDPGTTHNLREATTGPGGNFWLQLPGPPRQRNESFSLALFCIGKV